MGVGAQDDLGDQSFARKMTWLIHSEKALGFHWNWDGFSVRIEVISKKKKKKGLQWNWDSFSVQIEVISNGKKGGLRAHAEENLKGAKLPKKYEIAQNFDAKLPEKHLIAQNFNANMPKILTR